MAEAMTGLFGPSPYEIEQQRRVASDDAAQKFAQMNATQRGVMGMYQGGAGLARAGAGMFGMVDPAVQNAQRNEQELSGLDTQTPESILKTAQQVTDPRIKFQLMQLAEKKKTDISKQALEAAHAEFYKREKPDPKEIMMLDIAGDPNETDERRAMAKDWLAKNGRGNKGGTGRGVKFDAASGTYWLDPYTKKVTTLGGRELPQDEADKLVAASNDPALQGALSASKAGNKEKSEAMAKAQDALPEATNTFNQAVSLIGDIKKDPAFSSLIGFSWTPGAKHIPGSKEAGLDAMLQQLSSLAEMHQRDKLKGTGQITDYESNMARGAILRASNAQSEAAYRKAMDDFEHWMGKSMQALHERADTPFKMPTTPVESPAQTATPASAAPTVAPKGGEWMTDDVNLSKIKTSNDVKALYKQKKISLETANRFLNDMEANGEMKR